jgi:hypothetical protein
MYEGSSKGELVKFAAIAEREAGSEGPTPA